MNKERHLLVVSGPSGAGKDTVVRRMMEKYPEIELSVSATTRAPRNGEKEGIDYYFMTNEAFEQKIERGEMLEYVHYCDRYYGTPKSEVDRRLDAGIPVVLVIEVIGAANIKKLYPDSTLVFIMPPSLEELSRRLHGRGTEPEDVIQKRLARAQEEIERKAQYDFSVVNDDVDRCSEKVYSILRKRLEE